MEFSKGYFHVFRYLYRSSLVLITFRSNVFWWPPEVLEKSANPRWQIKDDHLETMTQFLPYVTSSGSDLKWSMFVCMTCHLSVPFSYHRCLQSYGEGGGTGNWTIGPKIKRVIVCRRDYSKETGLKWQNPVHQHARFRMWKLISSWMTVIIGFCVGNQNPFVLFLQFLEFRLVAIFNRHERIMPASKANNTTYERENGEKRRNQVLIIANSI